MESKSKSTFLRVGYNFTAAPPFVVELFDSNLDLSVGTQKELERFHTLEEALSFCEKFIGNDAMEITGGIRCHPSVYATVAQNKDVTTKEDE